MTTTTSEFDLDTVPFPAPLRLPTVAERSLPNGLRLICARRSSVPLVEACLSIPFGDTEPGASMVLASALVSAPTLQDRLRAMGAALSTGVDADRLRIAGSTLAEHLADFLALLAEVAIVAEFPADEIAIAVSKGVRYSEIIRSEPSHRVLEAWNRRMFGDHPYGQAGPSAEAIARVDRDTVLDLQTRRMRPNDASLVLVGDLDPDATLDLVNRWFTGWSPGSDAVAMPPVPPWVPGDEVVDLPGSTQSLLRLAMPAPRHAEPEAPALAMACMVFGGYFSSRLVQNIREDRGLSYSPRSGVLHVAEASLITIAVDAVTANTTAVATEVLAELARMVTCPVTPDELDRARRYTAGSLRLQLSTLTGTAAVLLELDQNGLTLDWLRDQDDRLAAVTPDQVTEAAGRHMTASNAVSVLLCDKDKVFT
ncbi:pitrilysin family protein [Kutzneria buriramensis]|uniref:Putative Zn-dependent peptidase n=1 Tax=Kutzneria buriramensis TaxID=1045776 RepID=A0A3E0GVE9_9PSEU|nr:pitrilysin family protein [Kutzneria buriramensis]REH27005.1 putative Zn-dependent peptidase [Kutzneria buriramensis]